MPPPPLNPGNPKSLEAIVDDLSEYPADAYRFVQEALSFAVQKVHGESAEPVKGRHISGQQLCQGLRDYATARWGMMARTVLSHWGISSTMDFGRIVFSLIENGVLQKTNEDSIEDFRNVYDFRTAFETKYCIPSKA